MTAIVIGAGPAGLAMAACLKRKGVRVTLLEQSQAVGNAWRNHYGRLHLHTARERSGLPHRPMPKHFGRYPSRLNMIEYLQDYADHFDLHPQFGIRVETVRPNTSVDATSATGPDTPRWRVEHTQGSHLADTVIFATGLNGTPNLPDIPGLDSFPGQILHSSAYQSPETLPPGPALVVGFGNSGGEIALDLAQSGRPVSMSVRGPVNILPKEFLGVPITSLGLLRKLFGHRLADRLTAPLLRAKIGRPEDYGLINPGKGPASQVVEDGRIPLIDIGTLDAIKSGQITIRPGLTAIDGNTARFTDGQSAPFDTLLLATGYRVDLHALLPDSPQVLDPQGRPHVSGGPSGADGLYFCSYQASAEGQLRQSGIEAQAIADLITT